MSEGSRSPFEGLDEASVGRLLDKMSQEKAKDLSYGQSEEYKKDLLNRYQQLLQRSLFSPGQLVKWKPNLRNRRFPEEASFGVVVEQREEAFFDGKKDPSSQYYLEPLDLAVAVLAKSDDEWQFAVYWFDSRRFEPVT